MSQITKPVESKPVKITAACSFLRAEATFALESMRPHNLFQKMFGLMLLIAYAAIVTAFLFFAIAHKTENEESFFYSNLFGFSDWGLAEIMGYGLEAMLTGIFVRIALKQGRRFWLFFAAIFTIILLDDMLSLHEMAGNMAENRFFIAGYLGEIVGFALIGVPILLFLFAGYYYCPKSGATYKAYILFTAYLGLLIFFGVVVDALHAFIETRIHISQTIGDLAEDGMELLILCLCSLSALNYLQSETSKA